MGEGFRINVKQALMSLEENQMNAVQEFIMLILRYGIKRMNGSIKEHIFLQMSQIIRKICRKIDQTKGFFKGF